MRPPIVAIYRFARAADDLADEGDAPAEERLLALARYRQALVHACLPAASLPGAPERAADPTAWPEIFAPLAQQVRRFNLPPAQLHALLDAFEQDVRNPAYADREALLDYCRRSANPIGRLLLHLYGIDDAASLARADAICTALQLINFWQDLSVDSPRGRHYVPALDRERHAVTLADLQQRRDVPHVRALVRELCEWAEALMLAGAPLALDVPGRAGYELRLVVQGGLRIIEKIAAMQHASLVRRPRLHAADVSLLVWRALRMRARPPNSATASAPASPSSPPAAPAGEQRAAP